MLSQPSTLSCTLAHPWQVFCAISLCSSEWDLARGWSELESGWSWWISAVLEGMVLYSHGGHSCSQTGWSLHRSCTFLSATFTFSPIIP